MQAQQADGAGVGIPEPGRWVRVWGIITFVMLLAVLGVCLADRGVTRRQKVLVSGLSILWAAWYWFFVAAPHGWRTRIAIRVASFVLSIALAAALAQVHVAFVALLFGYYGISFGALPTAWAVPVVVLSSMALALRFMDLAPQGSVRDNLLILAGFMGIAFFNSVLGLFVGAIVRQNRERQRMIEELEAARGELARAEREAGVTAERQRLAGEIHDTLAQGFTSVILQLQTALAALGAGGAPPDLDQASEARVRVERALDTARRHLAEARSVLWALQPQALERESLEAALRRIGTTWAEASGIAVDVEVAGDACPVRTAARVSLVRAAQEALANVRKHARARQVSMTLSYMGDEVALDVQDDGAGFDPGSLADASGYGLRGMRERVEQVGGRMDIESSPGEGTTVALRVPLDAAGAAAGPGGEASAAGGGELTGTRGER